MGLPSLVEPYDAHVLGVRADIAQCSQRRRLITKENTMQTNDVAAPIHGVDFNSQKYAGAELAVLRAHLERLAHEMRMKTRGADAKLQNRSRVLAREVTWFSEQASKPENKSTDYLIRLGASLHRKLRDLRNQVSMSIN